MHAVSYDFLLAITAPTLLPCDRARIHSVMCLPRKHAYVLARGPCTVFLVWVNNPVKPFSTLGVYTYV